MKKNTYSSWWGYAKSLEVAQVPYHTEHESSVRFAYFLVVQTRDHFETFSRYKPQALWLFISILEQLNLIHSNEKSSNLWHIKNNIGQKKERTHLNVPIERLCWYQLASFCGIICEFSDLWNHPATKKLAATPALVHSEPRSPQIFLPGILDLSNAWHTTACDLE